MTNYLYIILYGWGFNVISDNITLFIDIKEIDFNEFPFVNNFLFLFKGLYVFYVSYYDVAAVAIGSLLVWLSVGGGDDAENNYKKKGTQDKLINLFVRTFYLTFGILLIGSGTLSILKDINPDEKTLVEWFVDFFRWE